MTIDRPDETIADAQGPAAATLRARLGRFEIGDDSAFERLAQRLGMLARKAEAAPRRAVILVAVAWGMPLVLTLVAGTAVGNVAAQPFLLDWGAHARFLLAIGVFVMMTRLVHDRLRIHLRQFVDTPLLAPSAMPEAAAAVDRALRRGSSRAAELVCVVLAYALAAAGAVAQLESDHQSWFVTGVEGARSFTIAGWYCLLVSGPLFWFLLLRWLFRHAVWALLLRQIARLELRLVATHPDGVGGLAFIGQYPNAYAALVFAMSTVVAAAVARALQHDDLRLQVYGYVMGAWLAFAFLLFLVPLAAFTRPLTALKEKTLLSSTALATRHFRAAERAVFGGNLAAAADADDATDVPNPSAAFAAARKLGTLPFSRTAVAPLGMAALAPLILAGATKLPVAELWKIAKRLLLL